MGRNFGIPPEGKLGESSQARPLFFFDDRDFIAGIFAGLVLASGPLIVAGIVLFYL